MTPRDYRRVRFLQCEVRRIEKMECAMSEKKRRCLAELERLGGKRLPREES